MASRTKPVRVSEDFWVRVPDGRKGLLAELSAKKAIVQFGADGPFEKFWWRQLRFESGLHKYKANALRPKIARLKPEIERERNARWRHFGAVGGVKNASLHCRAIIDLPTATDETKQLAYQATQLLWKLQESMKERKKQGDNRPDCGPLEGRYTA